MEHVLCVGHTEDGYSNIVSGICTVISSECICDFCISAEDSQLQCSGPSVSSRHSSVHYEEILLILHHFSTTTVRR